MVAVNHSIRRREDRKIEAALKILHARLRVPGVGLNGVDRVAAFLALRFADCEREEFWALFLDSQNRLIEAERLFLGTLTQTPVYPREIVKRALALNAAGVIVAHNHPCGVAEPSAADEALTERLRHALNLVDVRLLDHFVIGGLHSYSFAQNEHAPFGARSLLAKQEPPSVPAARARKRKRNLMVEVKPWAPLPAREAYERSLQGVESGSDYEDYFLL